MRSPPNFCWLSSHSLHESIHESTGSLQTIPESTAPVEKGQVRFCFVMKLSSDEAKDMVSHRGGFKGGGIQPTADQNGPICTVLRYPFWLTDPKVFLKAPLAPIFTYFEEEARAKRHIFLITIFQKVLFVACFKKKLHTA